MGGIEGLEDSDYVSRRAESIAHSWTRKDILVAKMMEAAGLNWSATAGRCRRDWRRATTVLSMHRPLHIAGRAQSSYIYKLPQSSPTPQRRIGLEPCLRRVLVCGNNVMPPWLQQHPLLQRRNVHVHRSPLPPYLMHQVRSFTSAFLLFLHHQTPAWRDHR